MIETHSLAPCESYIILNPVPSDHGVATESDSDSVHSFSGESDSDYMLHVSGMSFYFAPGAIQVNTQLLDELLTEAGI